MVLIKPMCDVSKTNYTNLVIGYFNGKVIWTFVPGATR